MSITPRALAALERLAKGQLIAFPRGFGRKGDGRRDLVAHITIARLAEKGLVDVGGNGPIRATITARGRFTRDWELARRAARSRGSDAAGSLRMHHAPPVGLGTTT